MDAGTQTPQHADPTAALPPEITAAAEGTATLQQEKDALDWFLGATRALEYDVTFQYATPAGLKPVTFRLRQVDQDVMDTIDAENRRGDGPFATLDELGFNSGLVAAALVHVTDPSSGRIVDPHSDEFIKGMPGGLQMSLRVRFKKQAGILAGVAEQVKVIGGFANDRVGSAQRVVVDAGKDS